MRPNRRFAACLLLTLAAPLLAACTGDGETSTGDPDPILPEPDAGPTTCNAELQLGTGAREYQPVQDGDTVYLYRGPQGGYMIYLSVRAKAIDPADATVCYTETFRSGPEDGRIFGAGCWRAQLTNDLGDGWHERIGIWGQVDESYWASSWKINGKDARVDVTIKDTHGCQDNAGWTVHIYEELGT